MPTVQHFEIAAEAIQRAQEFYKMYWNGLFKRWIMPYNT